MCSPDFEPLLLSFDLCIQNWGRIWSCDFWCLRCLLYNAEEQWHPHNEDLTVFHSCFYKYGFPFELFTILMFSTAHFCTIELLFQKFLLFFFYIICFPLLWVLYFSIFSLFYCHQAVHSFFFFLALFVASILLGARRTISAFVMHFYMIRF